MIYLKTQEEMAMMIEGGQILAGIKRQLAQTVRPGTTGKEIDDLARELIIKAGAKVSFAMEPGYHWATCIDINDGVVHGIPNDYKFQEGDIVGLDVGLFFKGLHSDTTTTVGVGKLSQENQKMLEIGRLALSKAISTTKVGRNISDISRVIEATVKREGFSPVAALSGHGIGKHLHEDPFIPCVFVDGEQSPKIEVGMGLAIEVIYTAGSGEVAYGSQIGLDGMRKGSKGDGWTIVSLDGKISAAFEETVVVTRSGVIVTTRGQEGDPKS